MSKLDFFSLPRDGAHFLVRNSFLQFPPALPRLEKPACLRCSAAQSCIVPHLLATVLGMAALMHTSALAFQALTEDLLVPCTFAVDVNQPERTAVSWVAKPSCSTY